MLPSFSFDTSKIYAELFKKWVFIPWIGEGHHIIYILPKLNGKLNLNADLAALSLICFQGEIQVIRELKSVEVGLTLLI